jgi:hypothetical protein
VFHHSHSPLTMTYQFTFPHGSVQRRPQRTLSCRASPTWWTRRPVEEASLDTACWLPTR